MPSIAQNLWNTLEDKIHKDHWSKLTHCFSLLELGFFLLPESRSILTYMLLTAYGLHRSLKRLQLNSTNIINGILLSPYLTCHTCIAPAPVNHSLLSWHPQCHTFLVYFLFLGGYVSVFEGSFYSHTIFHFIFYS